jgi:hypothetical protein
MLSVAYLTVTLSQTQLFRQSMKHVYVMDTGILPNTDSDLTFDFV